MFEGDSESQAVEVLIVLILAIVGSLTLASNYVSFLFPFSQWALSVTPLAIALTTFYLSILITQEPWKKKHSKSRN